MKTSVRIALIALSVLMLASCKGKKQPAETAAPSISVATPEVKDITLTKDVSSNWAFARRVACASLPPWKKFQEMAGAISYVRLLWLAILSMS